MKKAVLMVSFGTSYEQARREGIEPVRRALEAAFPGVELREAYTSRNIGRILKGRGVSVENEAEALERLRADGYDDITAAVTHLIPGHEYDKLTANLPGCRVSAPLLATEADLERVAALLNRISAAEGRALVVMGHGTDHDANETYLRLREKLGANVYLACVEGETALETILPALDAMTEKRVALMPLMLVAGDHARNDLGGDDEDSWKSILEKRGFDVRVLLRGLGSYDEIQAMYAEKARAAAEK